MMITHRVVFLFLLTMFTSQLRSMVSTRVTAYQYDASVEHVFAENAELMWQNHAYDSTQNLLCCCDSKLIHSEKLNIQYGCFSAFVDGLLVTKGIDAENLCESLNLNLESTGSNLDLTYKG